MSETTDTWCTGRIFSMIRTTKKSFGIRGIVALWVSADCWVTTCFGAGQSIKAFEKRFAGTTNKDWDFMGKMSFVEITLF